MSKSTERTTRRSYTQCDLCDKKFKDHIMYELHKINDHIINLTENSPTKPNRHLLKALQNPYKCNFCDLTFPKTELLNVHIKNHFREICGGTPEQLNTPVEIDRKERNFECNVCGKLFLRKVHLLQHSRSHSGERPFKCKTCGNRYKYSCNLQIHERVHTGVKVYQCKYCEKAFDYKTNVIQHERVHTGEKPYVCDVCSKGFTQKFSMMRHRTICGKGTRIRTRANYQSEKKKYESENYEFSSDDTSDETSGFRGFDISEIKEENKSNKEEIFETEIIYTEPSGENNDYNQENIEYYPDNVAYQETVTATLPEDPLDDNQNKIENSFNFNPLHDHQYSNQIITFIKIEKMDNEDITPAELIKTEVAGDEIQHYDSDEIMYNEEIIIPYYEESIDEIKTSKRKSGDDEDIIIVDEPIQHPNNINTSDFDKSYEAKYNFETIIKKKSKRNHYSCDVCHLVIEDKNQFREHKLLHENKPFKCSYCPKSFIRNHDLQTHERIHTGENPYKCNYCDKTFDYKTNFIQHERIHTGVKPFKCGYCLKAFTQKASMLRHQNIHAK